VGVFDGTNIRLHVDGVFQDEVPSNFPLPNDPPLAWTVGKQNCDNPCTQNGFAGSIDELAVYDKVLPEARIQAHFAVGKK
jgi:hypothetical protein